MTLQKFKKNRLKDFIVKRLWSNKIPYFVCLLIYFSMSSRSFIVFVAIRELLQIKKKNEDGRLFI